MVINWKLTELERIFLLNDFKPLVLLTQGTAAPKVWFSVSKGWRSTARTNHHKGLRWRGKDRVTSRQVALGNCEKDSLSPPIRAIFGSPANGISRDIHVHVAFSDLLCLLLQVKRCSHFQGCIYSFHFIIEHFSVRQNFL